MAIDPTVMEAKCYGVFSCELGTNLLTAARKMADEDISALVVVDNIGFMKGILTRFDLIRARYTCEKWEVDPVEKWMNQDVITVSPKDRISHVASLLLKNHIHRVVAVNVESEGLRPIAVVSAADLVYHMAKQELAPD